VTAEWFISPLLVFGIMCLARPTSTFGATLGVRLAGAASVGAAVGIILAVTR
jgi:hypothetical protein